MSKIIFLFLVIIVLFLPSIVSAQGLSGPILTCGTKASGKECGLCDIFKIVQNVFNFASGAALIIAPLFLIAGGVMILTSGINPRQIEKGKSIISYTVIGLVIALLSWVIVNTTLNMVAGTTGDSAKPGGFPWAWNQIQCTGGEIAVEKPCTSDEDCPTGMYCDFDGTKKCVSAVNLTCAFDEECPIGYYCGDAGKCVSLSQLGKHICTCGENSLVGSKTYISESECTTNCSNYCSTTYTGSGSYGCCNTQVMQLGCFVTPPPGQWCRRTAPSGSNTWVLSGINSNQKGDANSSLAAFLNCMFNAITWSARGGLPSYLVITSISDDELCSTPPACNTTTGVGCSHTANSCHYGGTNCSGSSSAVDFGITADNCRTVADVALFCGGSNAWINWESTHLHVSLNRGTCNCPEGGSGTSCP